ncbi:hypothetical protein [Bradyrhizobium sp. P5_C11_2]
MLFQIVLGAAFRVRGMLQRPLYGAERVSDLNLGHHKTLFGIPSDRMVP